MSYQYRWCPIRVSKMQCPDFIDNNYQWKQRWAWWNSLTKKKALIWVLVILNSAWASWWTSSRMSIKSLSLSSSLRSPLWRDDLLCSCSFSTFSNNSSYLLLTSKAFFPYTQKLNCFRGPNTSPKHNFAASSKDSFTSFLILSASSYFSEQLMPKHSKKSSIQPCYSNLNNIITQKALLRIPQTSYFLLFNPSSTPIFLL